MNSGVFVRAMAAAVMACAGMAAGASAAEPPDKQATSGGPAISAEARPILEKQLKALQAAKSISGDMTFTWTVKAEGQDAEPRTNKESFAAAKPERVHMKTDQAEVFADGKTLTVYVPRLKQYITKPQPPMESLADELAEMTNGQISTVVAEEVVRPGVSLEQALRRFKSLDGVRAETVGGKPGRWVSGVTLGQEGAPPVKVGLFFPDGQDIKSRIRLDYTAFYKERAGAMADDEEPAPKVTSAVWDIVYDHVEIGKDIPAETFAFKPGAADKKVEEFGAARAEMPSQNGMLGLAAPAFEGKDLEGKDLKLGDLKGSVVVLDFWATWCGPCMAAIPKVQELKDKYAGKPVVFLGMNTDAPGSTSKVKKTLEKKKITIRQFDDSESAASQAYGVTGIPCMVMIDKAGVVQNIHVGFSPGEEEELAEEIDKMLAGKALKTEEEFKKAREKGGEGALRPARRGGGGGGGGNDIMSRGFKADELMRSGKLDEAADEYIWLWKHALENDPAYYGVRLSFMAGSMEELARKSPKAKEKFAAIRDETGKLLDDAKVDTRTDMDNAVDWVTLNKIVGDTDKTVAWVEKVKDERRWRTVMPRIGRDLEDLLAKKGRWADIGRLYTDPIHEIEQDHEIALMVPGERPRAKEGKRVMQTEAAKALRQRAGRIYAGLLAAKRDDDAAAFAARARELDDSFRMVRSLVETAEEAGQVRPEHAKWLEGDESKDKKP